MGLRGASRGHAAPPRAAPAARARRAMASPTRGAAPWQAGHGQPAHAPRQGDGSRSSSGSAWASWGAVPRSSSWGWGARPRGAVPPGVAPWGAGAVTPTEPRHGSPPRSSPRTTASWGATAWGSWQGAPMPTRGAWGSGWGCSGSVTRCPPGAAHAVSRTAPASWQGSRGTLPGRATGAARVGRLRCSRGVLRRRARPRSPAACSPA